MDEVAKLLKEDHCMIHKLPSYVKVFYSNPPDGLFIFTKGSCASSVYRSPALEKEDKFCASTLSPEADLTGTPMDFSCYSLRCNTILERKVSWLPGEEMYTPVSSQAARALLSKFLMNVKSCELPIFILCDDSKKHLLAACKVNNWYARSYIEYCGQCPSSCAEAKLRQIYPESHDSCSSVPEVFAVFELSESDALGRVVVELTWQELTLKVPQKGTSSLLMLEVNAGHENSKILCVWQQLGLVQRYFQALSEAKASGKCPALPVVAVASGNVTERIVDALKSQDHGVLARSLDEMKMGNELFDLIQQIVECKRPMHDATDEIWLLLTESKSMEEVTESLNTILTEIKDLKLSVFVSPSASTFLGSVINKLLKGQEALIKVSENIALEILIDSGIEKLQQDFIFLLKSMGIDCTKDFRKAVNSSDRMDAFKHNINALGKLYATLELVIVAQTYLKLSGESLTSLVKNVYKACINTVPSLNLLFEEPMLCVKLPIPYERISSQIPKMFSLCRATLSSTAEKWKSLGVLLFTLCPIFPPSVFTQGEATECDELTIAEEKFHVYIMETESDLF